MTEIPERHEKWWSVDGDHVFENGNVGPPEHAFGFGSENHGNNSQSLQHAILLAIDHVVKCRPELFS